MLVVGLGNSGPRYAFTRHNVGFMFLDKIASSWKKKYNFEYSIKDNLYMVKPLTYMNLSGDIFNYLNPDDFDDIIIVYDDVSLPLGKIRIRKKGSHGGHNGIKSLISYLGTNFKRIRIGIGPLPEDTDLVNFVLGEFSNTELKILDKVLTLSIEALKSIINDGIDKAMSLFNSKEVKV
ncbi:peptidyl-tRNA hydrolase [Thermosipho affectus]|uniref:Peptidyl-tRNA hydrolase n=1 Tax=Thermosipho affectus TaxID=660294 RepID=A0ABX3IKX8_9BACT|nr:aminoacyl-tRNA hydrolase [Thermosipho affectus]ONN27847.1 peptidyl-tRNA hydrolase [Thermosipho affectus]